MINHIVDVHAKPGRAADFCRAIQDNLSIWRAQPGFVDEIVLLEPGTDHVVAQSFWSTLEDADRFNRDVFPQISAIVKDFMAAPPQTVTYLVAVSTNRNIVPDGTVVKTITQRSRPNNPQSESLALQAMKLPPAVVVASLELLLQLSRGAQNMYDATIDETLGRNDRLGQTQAATPTYTPAQSEVDMVRETLNGLIAFVAPGPDPYSVAQGESTSEPGGCDAGILDALIRTINASQPTEPQGPAPVSVVVDTLNEIAHKINPSAQGPFESAFACLSVAEKAAVFEAIESNPQARPLAAVLPATAFLIYSEAAVFDPVSRTIRSRPLGWDLSNYEGVANGRAEFKGYYQNRRSVQTDPAITGR